MSKSAALYERAKRVLPGGCSRNTVLKKPHPFYAARGEGCHIIDIEGTRRLDFANNMASLIHGHAHPAIVDAVTQQLQLGTAFTMPTEVEVRFAEHLCGRNPGFEKLRFVNSGTEAVMGCLKAARAFTGRARIAKVEGAYHGQYDFAEVSQTASPANWGDAERPQGVPVAYGTPRSVLDDVTIIPFNDPRRAVELLDEHAGEFACVLVDVLPHRVGLIPASAEFIETLYAWTRRHDALLVFDEVITFRSEYGGAAQWYGVRPDLTALGKIIGGGFPVGALAGRAEVMAVMDPLVERVLFPHSGTFSANPVSMTAGLTAMELFDESAVARVNELAGRARRGIERAIDETGVPCCVTGGGSMLRVHFKPTAPRNYREAFASAEELRILAMMLEHLWEEGFVMINTCSATMSTAMRAGEVDGLVDAMHRGFEILRGG